MSTGLPFQGLAFAESEGAIDVNTDGGRRL